MNITISIQVSWASLLISAFDGALFAIIAILSPKLCCDGYFDIFIIMICIYLLLIGFQLYVLKCGTEVAKKALDLQIELEKRRIEKEERIKEDARCDKADQELRAHELALACSNNTIKVEVSNV